jgi:predicted dehydrogenase
MLGPFHEAPHLGCTCGLHGTHGLDVLRRTRCPAVLGRVALWGRVIEHAVAARFLDVPGTLMADGRGRTVTVEKLYLRALLIDRFATGSLTRQQVEIVDAWLWHWEAALKAPGVDAVIITTPSGAHREPALVAAAAGKHVVVEKPLEITGPRCQEIIDACDLAGVRLCTIFPSRFGDANTALKQAVDAGKFGRLTLGETTCKWWRGQKYYDEGGWKGTQALDGGGALMNQAIHNVDLLLWMMGPAAAVSGFTARLAHESRWPSVATACSEPWSTTSSMPFR